MKSRTLNTVTALALAALLTIAGMLVTQEPIATDAASVVSQQTVTVMDGTTVYTTTSTTSDPAFSAYYGELTAYVSNTISGTGTITVTPQISLQPVACASATEWTTATVSNVSSTPSYDTANVQFTVGAGASAAVSFPAQGRCTRLRIQLASSTQYTPTAYIRMVNAQ